MEDSFWESPYNSSLHDEYFSIKSNTSNIDFSKKQELLFNNSLRAVKDNKVKSGLLTKPMLKDLTQNNNLNIAALPLYSEESLMNTSQMLLKDFNLFSNEMFVDSTEDNYESAKYMNYLYHLNYKNILNSDDIIFIKNVTNKKTIQKEIYININSLKREDFIFYLNIFTL